VNNYFFLLYSIFKRQKTAVRMTKNWSGESLILKEFVFVYFLDQFGLCPQISE
jgi:hypothetical protein